VVDFGCGLGRNLPMLQGIFPRTVGLDIPEMIGRLRAEQSAPSAVKYDAVYDDLDQLLRSESVHFVYDSVVFQHIIDMPSVASMIERLVADRNFIAMVSLSITSSPPPALELLSASYGWQDVFTEIESVSFDGAPHQLRLLCRPRDWRLVMRYNVIGIEPAGGDWRPIVIGGQLAQPVAGWEAAALLTSLAPTLLLVFQNRGERAVWYIDERGNFLGNQMSDLPAAAAALIRHTLRQIIARTVRGLFTGAGPAACAELLELVAPAA
jgi:hypothetical protein